jgi:DNA-binding CsgD family transcriptional regulator
VQRFEKWTETYVQLLKADQENALEPKGLERLALAAFLTGKDAESFQFLERAHQGYLDQGEMEQAVRCAFWLGMMLMNAGEKARSSGWFARGERLLNDEQSPDCAEKGLLLLPEALETLSAGQTARAQKIFELVETIGEQFRNADLIALGRLGHGQAMIFQGDVAKGVKLLDETMVTVETEEVFPLVNGIVYCAVIETCRKVWDLKRAQEWTSALTRWCEAQPDIVPFRGECLVRRAEIIQFHGEWPKALEETKDACDLLTRHPGESTTGEAYYRKGELQRLLGDFEAAEDSYHEAAKWGRRPQPGLALLRLAQGQDDAAETSIRNTLQEIKDKKRRAEILPAVVRIMIAVKRSEEALEAAKELKGIADQFDTPYLHAMYSYSQGAVFLAEGNVKLALEHLQEALKLWNSLHLPYESACTRELKGLVYSKLDDKDNSDVELAAAKWVFEQLNARPDLKRVNQLLNKKRNHETYGLTLRELQVLRLVASGKTNKSIAGELFISERTVDRHVSNIFNKLGVSSRVEATAFAFRDKILDNAL